MTAITSLLQLNFDQQSIAQAKQQLGRAVTDVKQQLSSLKDAGKIDNAQLLQATAATEDLGAQMTVTASRIADAKAALGGLEGNALERQQAAVTKLQKRYTDLAVQLGQVPNRMEAAFERANREAMRGADEVAERYEANYRRVSQGVSVYGDVDTGLATTAGLVSAVGGNQAAQGLMLGSDLFAVSEALPRMATGLGEIGQRARNAAPLLNTMAGGFQTLIPALSGGAAGLLALGAAALPIAAVAGAAALAINTLIAAENQRRQVAEGLANGLAVEARAFADAQDLLADGDTAGALAEIERLNQQRVNLTRQMEYIDGAIAEARARRDDWDQNRRSGSFEGVRQAEADIRELEKILTEGIFPQLGETQIRLGEFQQLIDHFPPIAEDAATAAESAALSEEELAARRQQSATTLQQLADQEAVLLANRERSLRYQAEDRSVAAARDLEDYEETVVDHNQRIADLRTRNLETLESVETNAAKQREKAETNASKQLAKVRDGIQMREAKANQQFHKEQLKAERDFNKALVRARQDLRGTIWEAELANDILAIEQAKRAAATEAERNREDFDEQQVERATQRETELAELRADGQVRISEIKAQLAEQKQAITIQLNERIGAEKFNLERSMAQEQAAWARQEASRAKRLRRQEEDQQRADARAQAAFDLQIAAIEGKRDAELNALHAVESAANDMLANLSAQASSSGSSNRSRSGDSQNVFRRTASGSADRIRQARANQTIDTAIAASDPNNPWGALFGFANGGIVPAGTGVVGHFERNRSYDEAVIPLSKQALSRYMPSGPSISYNGNITVNGDGVTADQVRMAVINGLGAIAAGTQAAINGTGAA